MDWIYIQQLNRTLANLGMFSMRDFPKGSTIGYYCDPVTWTAARGGRRKQRDEDGMIGQAGNVEGGSMSIRNSEMKWWTVVPKKVQLEEMGQQPLYLGMHYINSASLD